MLGVFGWYINSRGTAQIWSDLGLVFSIVMYHESVFFGVQNNLGLCRFRGLRATEYKGHQRAYSSMPFCHE